VTQAAQATAAAAVSARSELEAQLAALKVEVDRRSKVFNQAVKAAVGRGQQQLDGQVAELTQKLEEVRS